MKFFPALFLSAILCTAILFAPESARAENAPVEQVLSSTFVQSAQLSYPKAIRAFYERRGAKLYWQGYFDLTNDAEALIYVLNDSWTHGLNPRTYHLGDITEFRKESGPAQKAQLDMLLTDAFLRYVRDMSGARVDTASLGLDPSDWLHPYTPERTLAFLEEGLNLRTFLNSLPPKSYTYNALRKELVRLAAQPEEPYAAVLPISFGGKLLQPAARHKRIPDLRLRMGVQPQTRDEYYYDDRLAAAVMKFQQAAGMEADGIVGPTTLKLLNQSNSDKILSIVANMERLRWVREKKPERFVMVNIPSATLWAIEDQKIQFEMPVIVGKPARATIPFIADIQGVRFNPDWTVPPTIKREDILPKLLENPAYLADKGMELIYNGPDGAETIDPSSVDWEDITPQDLHNFDMVQIPGSHNPLGKIRILMPNKYNIYLHDTNQPEYFNKNTRAQSSGCIRMKEPKKMAAFVLEREEGWDEKKMATALKSARTRDVRISAPIPVYILYYTVWIDRNEKVVFGNDIYGLDRDLIAKLSDIDGFYIPGHTQKSKPGSGRS